jgi:ribosomal protein S18 acetylase RimI-like enzyme
MKTELYFLRSTEQKIATDMLHYAARLDEVGKTLDDFPELGMYEQFYGLNRRDQGLYAICGHELAGAAWIRLIHEEKGPKAFIDEATPVLTIGVKPQFRGQGIGTQMLEQLLLEAGALYDKVSVSVVADSPAVRFYERFGFEKVAHSENTSPVDGKPVFTMVRHIERKEVERPSDGYDPTYWMD